MAWTKGPSAVTAIDRVLLDEDPLVKELAKTTYDFFKKIAYKMTSSIIKQSFRRFFNFIYIKKVKPLYNYSSPRCYPEVKETSNYESVVEEWDICRCLGAQLIRQVVFPFPLDNLSLFVDVFLKETGSRSHFTVPSYLSSNIEICCLSRCDSDQKP